MLFLSIYLLCVQTGHWKCRGMPMPEPVDVNTQLLKSSSLTAAPCHIPELKAPPWAPVFNLVKVKAHFWPTGHTEKRRRMFCPGFCCILTFALPKHKLLMFKYIILFTSSFQELPDFSPASNLPLYRHQTSILGLHNLHFLWVSALLPSLSPLRCFPALFIAPVFLSSSL